MQWMKSYTVMDVSCGNNGGQHKAMLITGCVCFVGKTMLLIPFSEHTACRNGYRNRNLLFFRRLLSVVLERRLSMVFSVAVDFLLYLASAVGTVRLILRWMLALALICVPSIYTASGTRHPAGLASYRIH